MVLVNRPGPGGHWNNNPAIISTRRSGYETVIDGLQSPQGILTIGDVLYIVDVGAKELIQFDMKTGARQPIATELPVGAPPGVVPKFLGPIGILSGAMGPFAGIAAGQQGELYVSADAEGSVLKLQLL